jgi:TRAP-type mannitol/chloroaromatic compound transport system permease small subunit
VLLDRMLQLSNFLRSFTERVGKIGSVFILPLVGVTIWDVMIRKVGGIQVWMIEHVSRYIGSTIVQELEWHFHTALFTLVLGYGFVANRHVRVDLVREKLAFRKQAWIEFFGCTLFMIPYCLIVGYFAFDYAVDAYVSHEISASTVGLTNRWIIKSVLVIGLFVAASAGIAVWLQTVVVLLGPSDKRFPLMTLDWPEEAQRKARAHEMATAQRKAEDAATSAPSAPAGT